MPEGRGFRAAKPETEISIFMLLHFFVEEESAEAALIELVPRILAGRDFDYEIFVFQGKQNMLKRLPARLKAYAHRPGDDWRIIVLIDRDNDDCLALKRQLEELAAQAGLVTRSRSIASYQLINRIAIEELEAWFFGDIEAIRSAYPRISGTLDRQTKFRDPDAIRGGTWESLEDVLKPYHPGGLEKIRAAREIARHMQPDRNRSASFCAFRDALRALFPPP
jgi:hypothetical protein